LQTMKAVIHVLITTYTLKQGGILSFCKFKYLY
jgi:hypothetical protein